MSEAVATVDGTESPEAVEPEATPPAEDVATIKRRLAGKDQALTPGSTMKRLTGLESLYLRLETDSMPMNMSSLTIYDRSAAPGGKVEFADIQRFIAERAYRAGLFRRRLATLPLSMARQYWVDDPGFDIEFHVRHLALPKPGDWRQLCTQVARLHARPLDRSRPLWECYVIEELDNIQGLPPGSFALFFKTHYAALGGVLAMQLFTAMHELAPDARASAPKDRRYFDHAPTLVGDLAARVTAKPIQHITLPQRSVQY